MLGRHLRCATVLVELDEETEILKPATCRNAMFQVQICDLDGHVLEHVSQYGLLLSLVRYVSHRERVSTCNIGMIANSWLFFRQGHQIVR